MRVDRIHARLGLRIICHVLGAMIFAGHCEVTFNHDRLHRIALGVKAPAQDDKISQVSKANQRDEAERSPKKSSFDDSPSISHLEENRPVPVNADE